MKCFHMTLSALNIISTRLLFVAHAFLVLWRTTDALNKFYWFLMIFLFLYIFDLYWVLIQRKTREWHWFSVSVFIYLIVVMPCFWSLRIDQLSTSQAILRGENCTNSIQPDGTPNINLACNTSQQIKNDLDKLIALDDIQGVKIPLRLTSNTWIEVLEQSMIFILIVTRWIAPFYSASHRKLSESLFIYLGIGSDIIELFVLFEERYVVMNDVLYHVVLGAWTLSIVQFLLPLTGALAPSRKTKFQKGSLKACLNSEAITILAIVALQDGPFLGLRLYVIIVGNVLTYTLIFFTCKNILLILLQFYRLIVLLRFVDPATGKTVRRKERNNGKDEEANGVGGDVTNRKKRDRPKKTTDPKKRDREGSAEQGEEESPRPEVVIEDEVQEADKKSDTKEAYYNEAFSEHP